LKKTHQNGSGCIQNKNEIKTTLWYPILGRNGRIDSFVGKG